ncbi:hypothetical protein [Deinococcus budaensis]|uniref:Uncharacterized protein n=1 Tax=Deinococcus budaensis TaxID=1665626 RepID=A0A7W8GGN7_9DEIO|nr:hypothetical protein [Deinococcus budaensis]MBB5235285.1 hypothetical protein [Deinococcus budaensis]
MTRRGARVPALALLAALSLGLGVWWASESRWRGPLYCIEQPGRVWGLSPLPAEFTPTCPQSRSYRREVREGSARVEQYTLAGWRPRALFPALQAAGFVSEGGENGIYADEDEYADFLRRGGEQLQYVAERLPGEVTRVTLSGRPAAPR